MRGYDAWLEAPYRRMEAQAEAEERAWESLGVSPDELEAPHKPGDPCPHCAEPGAVALATDTDIEGWMACIACGADVIVDEKPTFNIGDWMQERCEAAAEAAAEDRYEMRRGGW